MCVIESNKDCYDPLIVLIGPYHHGKLELKAFEKLKIPIALKFLRAYKNKVPSNKYMKRWQMWVKGACFVLHFLSTLLKDNGQNEVDQRLDKSRYIVWRDFLLLENQIPFLVLKVMLEFRFHSKRDQTLFVEELIEYFTIMPPQKNLCTRVIKKLLAQMKESDEEMNKGKLDLDSSFPLLLHVVREHFISPFMHERKNKNKFVRWESYCSVTELKLAGIHFKPSQTGNFTDLKSCLIYGTLPLLQAW